jgi:rhodanese-related sulfurtransferase
MYFKQFLLIFFFNVWFINSVFADVGQTSNLQLKEMMLQGVELIDIRRAEEWKQTGVVRGSHLLTFFDKKGNYDVKKWLASLDKIVDKNKPFILICRTGNRTGMVSNFLDKKLHYKQVNHLSKGITNWIKSGYAVVKPE